MAAQADRLDLYERSVQVSEADVEFYDTTYRALRGGKKPLVLREDFGGTAKLSMTWCLSDPQRTALAVDLDAPTLAWGRERNVVPHQLEDRLQLVEANVLDVAEPKADVTCAMNFSYCIFKTREELKAYFQVAFDGLADDGLFICELFGGTEAIVELEEEREVEDFTYVWDQERFNPITREILCHIHFTFEDGSKIRRAFTYDWRLWTIPELREVMEEVGFESVRVYWEETDEEDEDGELEGSGEYVEKVEVENQESWLVYVVGEK